MQTLLFILIAFLMTLFSIGLYLKQKNQRKIDLINGICPVCKEGPKVFTKNDGTKFKIDIIKAKLLKNHGCSGVSEIEYKCESCGHKEVHQSSNGGCGI